MFTKIWFIIARYAAVKKITMNMSAVLNKQTDANTGKDIDTSKNRPYRMSNKKRHLPITVQAPRVWGVGTMSVENVVG